MLADYASDDENDDVLLKVDDLNREFKVRLYEKMLLTIFYSSFNFATK
jgi:hypothetical protein